MTKTSLKVLELLASGKSISGEMIGEELGVTRMAISKCIRSLIVQGLDIDSVPGKGYQLNTPVQLLDRDMILSAIEQTGTGVQQLEVLHAVESTSDYLLDRLKSEDVGRHICLAENQAAGRGRRERGWHAGSYRNITLSIGWKFEESMSSLSGLGIASGIAIVNALHEAGFDEEIGLKWPNDIVWMDHKLGGLIIDVRGEHHGPCHVVLGLGLNLSLSKEDKLAIDQRVIALEEITQSSVDRNSVATLLITALVDLFETYQHSEFQHWRDAWDRVDRLSGREISVIHGDQTHQGIAAGIDSQGALLLDQGGREYGRFFSGDVSLRLRS
jgi:BirA family biotin operon repressor/biotin-[acetyl-CoA-carboxylase] ligase